MSRYLNVLQTQDIGKFMTGLLWATAVLAVLDILQGPFHNAFATFMEFSNFRAEFIGVHESTAGVITLQKVLTAAMNFVAGGCVYLWSSPNKKN